VKKPYKNWMKNVSVSNIFFLLLFLKRQNFNNEALLLSKIKLTAKLSALILRFFLSFNNKMIFPSPTLPSSPSQHCIIILSSRLFKSLMRKRRMRKDKKIIFDARFGIFIRYVGTLWSFSILIIHNCFLFYFVKY